MQEHADIYFTYFINIELRCTEPWA